MSERSERVSCRRASASEESAMGFGGAATDEVKT